MSISEPASVVVGARKRRNAPADHSGILPSTCMSRLGSAPETWPRRQPLHMRNGNERKWKHCCGARSLDDERCRHAANQLPTRQIANAMAGVLDIGWRRSLDSLLCSAFVGSHCPKHGLVLSRGLRSSDPCRSGSHESNQPSGETHQAGFRRLKIAKCNSNRSPRLNTNTDGPKQVK